MQYWVMQRDVAMKSKLTKRIVLVSGAAAVGAILLFFLLTGAVIGSQVSETCQDARRIYGSPGPSPRNDCVFSLITLLFDEHQDFQSRNRAIWALGQLGDARAFAVLARYYTGKIPSRESPDRTISQYELRKAIALTTGSINITAVVWRHGY